MYVYMHTCWCICTYVHVGVCVYMHMHICNVTDVLTHRSSKSAKHLKPRNSDTEEDSLSTSQTRYRSNLKDLSSFDKASKKFLEEMKETFLRLEKEAKVRMNNTHTFIDNNTLCLGVGRATSH